MKKVALSLAVAGAALVSVTSSGQAISATADTVYVDPVSGADGNNTATPPCNPGQPCQTIPGAIVGLPADTGTVVVTKDGNFPPLTITRGLTISCPGVACIFDSSGGATGITITAATTDSIALNNTSISGFGTGGTGIQVNSVGKIEMKNVGVSGNATGIMFAPSSGSSAHWYLYVSEIHYSSNINVEIAPTSSVGVSADFNNVRIHDGNAGVRADATTGTGGISLVVANSHFAFTNSNVINAVGNASGAGVNVILDHVDISHSSGNGVQANGVTARVVLNQCVISQTNTPWNIAGGGTIDSYGNNALRFNTNPGAGALTAVTTQ